MPPQDFLARPETATAPGPQTATPTVADASTAAVGQSSELQGSIQRKPAEGGGATAAGAAAGAILETAKAESAGQGLPDDVRTGMEASFGADFSQVQVHTDTAAQAAASELNANAFTSGNDVFFGAGQYNPGEPDGQELLAHELTHVAQGGAPGGPTTVSQPGDTAEKEADSAASAVAAGGQAGPIQRQAATVSRDPVSDFETTAGGNWLGNIDINQAITQVQGMSQPERASLVTNEQSRASLRRVFRQSGAPQTLQLIDLIPMDLRWRLFFVDDAGIWGQLTQENWIQIIGVTSPTAMNALRQYPWGFRAFINNAPALLVGPADKLAALFDGIWNGTAEQVLAAVYGLNPTQKDQLRGDDAHMRILLTKVGPVGGVFSCLAALNTPLKWTVWYLNVAGVISQLLPAQWSQILMEAPKAEWDELQGWAEAWQLCQTHCPDATLSSLTLLNGEDGTVDDILANAPTIAMSFNGMGATGFLAAATQANSDIAGNYAKIKAAGYVDRTIAGLPAGETMGVRTAANLKQWFDAATGETDVPTLSRMISRRFDIDFNAGTAGTAMANKHNSATTTVGPWTADGLRRCWPVMERLPPGQIAQNDSFLTMLRQVNAGNGNAYFWQNDVVMGYQADGELTSNVGAANASIYTGAAVNTFNATLRHEIGHAVDNQLGVMNAMRTRPVCGNWTKYASYTELVDAMIAAGGGIDATSAVRHGYPAADWSQYRAAMIHAVTNTVSFNTALQVVKPGAAAAPDAGPISAVFITSRWTGGGSGPWYQDGDAKPQGGRIFQRAYDSATGLWSYDWATRQAKELTKYQWRAPGEWFAEVYQVYYSEQETAANVPVGGRLRAKDSEAADLMSSIVDRGYSPQQMTDGSTVAAPNPNG